MPVFRVYRLSLDGHIVGPAVDVVCDGDGPLLASGIASAPGLDVEAWHGGQLVCRIHDHGLNPAAAHLVERLFKGNQPP